MQLTDLCHIKSSSIVYQRNKGSDRISTQHHPNYIFNVKLSQFRQFGTKLLRLPRVNKNENPTTPVRTPRDAKWSSIVQEVANLVRPFDAINTLKPLGFAGRFGNYQNKCEWLWCCGKTFYDFDYVHLVVLSLRSVNQFLALCSFMGRISGVILMSTSSITIHNLICDYKMVIGEYGYFPKLTLHF